MSNIRPFVERDTDVIAELYSRVFGATHPYPPDAMRAYFRELFLENPWRGDGLPSLIYEEGDRIIGFLGVVPRRLQLRSREIRLAVSNHFMVDPAHRGTLAGVKLLKFFFNGPQDLSLAESGMNTRKIWECVGGETSILYSLYWTRPLRPSRYLLTKLESRGAAGSLLKAMRPFTAALDAAASMMGGPLALAPQAPGTELTETTFLSELPRLARSLSLQPVYDEASLRWLFAMLASKKRRGQFQKVAVIADGGKVAGWYLYYLKPGGICEVIQIAAERESIRPVLAHLFYHARAAGAIAVAGQLEPRFAQEFSDEHCLIHRGAGSVLIHSNRADVREAIYRGDAFLTRLEGEWWVSYQ